MARKSVARRTLAVTPSNPADMSPHAHQLQAKLKVLFEHLVKERVSFADHAYCYQLRHSRPGEALAKLNGMLTKTDIPIVDMDMLKQPTEPGHLDTVIVQWSFKAQSMWRGEPQNPNVYRIAKSIIAVGFRKDMIAQISNVSHQMFT